MPSTRAASLWAAFAAVCLAGYFLLSAISGPSALLVVGVGMVGGWILLAVAAAVGLLAVQTSTDPVTLGGTQLPWWAVAAALVLIATVFAYLTGIAAARRLGHDWRRSSPLMELVMATVLSAVLLSQTPGPREILGGVVIPRRSGSGAPRRAGTGIAAAH